MLNKKQLIMSAFSKKKSQGTHPLPFIRSICDDNRTIERLEFSCYEYTPQSVEDTRTIYDIPANKLEKGYQKLKDGLKNEEEIACHSRVYLESGVIRHIPFLDLSGKFSNRRIQKTVDVINDVFDDFKLGKIAFFESGRSYHLYGARLLSENRWKKFLGRALLLNLPDEKDIVDQRWIGHRLIAGYGTLRWTCHTDQYRQEPAEIHRASFN